MSGNSLQRGDERMPGTIIGDVKSGDCTDRGHQEAGLKEVFAHRSGRAKKKEKS